MNGLEPVFQKQGLQDCRDFDEFFVQYINDKTDVYLKAWSTPWSF
jgi:hypothetical protein